MSDLLRDLGITVRYAGEDPNSEYSRLRDRIKTALNKIEPALGDKAGLMTGASVRSLINALTRANIPNGELMETMRSMADAIERRAHQ